MANDKSIGINRVGNTLEDVRRHVQDIVAETFQTQAPVQIFQQGNRTMVSTTLPIKVLRNTVLRQSANKGETADRAIGVSNRPIVPEHQKNIATYLVNSISRGENYILPPITLNSNSDVQIFVPGGDARTNSGYMILPDENSIQITDGQHRFLAINEAMSRLSPQEAAKFANDSVPVMMTLSEELSQVHQDFADAGKTKALPPSLLAVWDTRKPDSHVVLQISQQVGVLAGRVDATSTNIGKSSPFIFLANQVRQFVKGSLTGNASISERLFEEQAEAALANRESRERWIRSRVAFLNVMTDLVPDWKEISELSQPNGPDADLVVQKTKDIRERLNISMTGAFLTTLGPVSHKLLKDATATDKSESDWEEELRWKLRPLRDVSWERSAKIWNGNIIVTDDNGNCRIRTQGPAVKGASDELLKVLGIAE